MLALNAAAGARFAESRIKSIRDASCHALMSSAAEHAAHRRWESANALLQKVVLDDPQNGQAWHDMAAILLVRGQLGKGFRLYEKRNALLNNTFDRFCAAPVPTPEQDIDGAVVLVHQEGGLGDSIHFCRYIPKFFDRGARVLLQIQPSLREMVAAVDPRIVIYEPEQDPSRQQCNFRVPMMSLPYVFGTDLSTVPADNPYLRVDRRHRCKWASSVGSRLKPRIGLAWSGDSGHVNDHNRSMTLAQLVPLLDFDAEWIVLQKVIRERDADTLSHMGNLRSYCGALETYSDTAALIHQVDLVIAVDTSIAHMSAALGKPTFIMLPKVPEWRWMLDREDTPWYPSARLFRQHLAGDWTGPIEAIRRELDQATAKPLTSRAAGGAHFYDEVA